MDLKQALATLDHANDDHWTGDGLPGVKAIEALIGRSTSRKEITEAAPDLMRQQAQAQADPQPKEPELADPAQPRRSRREVAEDELQRKQAALLAVTQEKAQLQSQADRLEREIASLGSYLDRTAPRGAKQSTIRGYLDGQQTLREQRGELITNLRGSGLNEVVKVIQKSKLDVAMSRRKPGHGDKRPGFQKGAGG